MEPNHSHISFKNSRLTIEYIDWSVAELDILMYGKRTIIQSDPNYNFAGVEDVSSITIRWFLENSDKQFTPQQSGDFAEGGLVTLTGGFYATVSDTFNSKD